jgi:LysM repeat protein
MEDPTPIIIPADKEPRYCPVCGSRVADLATNCLMCGASLEVEEETPVEEAPRRRLRIPWRGILVSIVTVAAFIGLIGWLVRAQMTGYTPTPTPAFTATRIRPPTRTPEPSETPAPLSSPTSIPPRPYEVQEGDTCISIASDNGISLDTLAILNSDKCPSGVIRPGDILLIPAATPTPGPAPTVGPGTPLPTQECPIIHVVQAGETALAIAERYNISLGVLEAANPDKDLAQLQVNQVLQVPCGTPTPTLTPTIDPNATPTPIPKYAPPALLSPPDGATLTTLLVPLQWTAVSLLREDEMYAVRLRRLDQDSRPESIYTRMTLLRLNQEYAPSPGDPLREYSWEVTVVREITVASGETRYTAASHPSGRRTFRWLAPTPEPTSDVTFTP